MRRPSVLLGAAFLLGLSLVDTRPTSADEDPPGALGGRVVAADTGAGLSGVLVTAYSDSRGEAHTARTNAQGIFALGNLPPGRYFVDFTAPEGSRYASQAMFVEEGVNRGGGRETSVKSGRTTFLKQELEVGAEIELRFEDTAGVEWNPAAKGAEPRVVIVEDFPDGAQRRLTPTAVHHEGPLRRTVFTGLPRSSGATVLSQVPGYMGLTPPPARLAPGERSVVYIRLDRSDPTGVGGLAPPGAQVVVVSEPGGRQVSEISAGADGSFAITGFYPGLYGLRVNGIREGLIQVAKGVQTRVDLRQANLATQRPLLPVLPPPGPTTETGGDSALVHTDLIIRDGSGKILRDTRPEEIQVFEDGVEREVVGLRHVDMKALSGEPGGHLTLVVDQVSAQGWEQAMAAATELLKHVAAGSHLAALRIGSGVEPLLPATTDREAALTALAVPPPKLGDPPSEVELMPDPVALEAMRTARGFGAQLRDHRPLYDLSSIVHAQAALPGRKVLVFLCEGFALSTEHEGLFHSLIAAANRAGVSIYVVDLRGMSAEEQMAVAQAAAEEASQPEQSSPEGEGATGELPAGSAVTDWQMLLEKRANERAVVEELARGTGGFVIANRDLLKRGLEWIADDVAHYDALDYKTDAASGNGVYRRVRVRVARPATRAQHRDGYFTLVPEGGGPLLMYEVPLLRALHQGEARKDFPLHVSTLTFGATGDGVCVAWLAEMSRSDITFASQPRAAGLRGRVAFLALVRDAQGEVVLRRTRALPVTGPRERLAELGGQRIQFVEHAILPPGRYTVEAALGDVEGGRVATERQPLEVAAPRRGLDVSSVVVASGFMTPSVSDPSDPLQVRSFRVVPSGDGSAHRAVGMVTIPVYCVVTPIPGEQTPPDFTLEVLRQGRIVSSGSVRLPEPDHLGTIRHVSSVPLGRLRDGDYEVRVRVEQGGQTVQRSTSLALLPKVEALASNQLRVVERPGIDWPAVTPTNRVLLDRSEEKVALDQVPPQPPREGKSSNTKWVVAAVGAFGLGGAVAVHSLIAPKDRISFGVTPEEMEGIASATAFRFEANGCDALCTWSFGDGGRSAGPFVSHVYRDAGSFTVQLSREGVPQSSAGVLVRDLSGIWRLRGHFLRFAQARELVSVRCDDDPSRSERWECSWEGQVSTPDHLLVSGPWTRETNTGEILESRPVVVEGEINTPDGVLVRFDGDAGDLMTRFYGSR